MLEESVELLYPDLVRGVFSFRQARREDGNGKQAGLFGG